MLQTSPYCTLVDSQWGWRHVLKLGKPNKSGIANPLNHTKTVVCEISCEYETLSGYDFIGNKYIEVAMCLQLLD